MIKTIQIPMSDIVGKGLWYLWAPTGRPCLMPRGGRMAVIVFNNEKNATTYADAMGGAFPVRHVPLCDVPAMLEEWGKTYSLLEMPYIGDGLYRAQTFEIAEALRSFDNVVARLRQDADKGA